MHPLSRFPLISALSSLLIVACAAPPTDKEVAQATQGIIKRQDVEIVDCLLPGQVRNLGNSTFITPRRPTRTTASDCRIRGGEYVAFDRADMNTALKVWLQNAEAGDAEAQTTVGEIYERGLGATPNYTAALQWYQKAADQGSARATASLAAMYEQGLGVETDKLKALNLYRQAWGLPEDNLMYQSAAAQEAQQVRAELQAQLAEKDSQLALLKKQLSDTETKLASNQDKSATATSGLSAELASLKNWIAKLETERTRSNNRLTGISTLRTPLGAPVNPDSTLPTASKREVQGMDFGRFYALVIGNQHYQRIDNLQTPISDAQRAAKVLADKYGFTVKVLEDASDILMLQTLNELNAVLKPNDNLLIYYAGHGTRLQTGTGESGYWLPVNADAPPQDTYWVPNEQITAHIARLQATRVLVVADSCYAGLLAADPSYLFVDGKNGYSAQYIKYKLPKRSRLLLSSGGNQPVLDVGGGNNSVFARAFLEELEANKDSILAAPELFSRIRKRVTVAAANNKFVQTPEFKSIKGAGHEVGDFFFVPKT
jgi:uncharacterized protein